MDGAIILSRMDSTRFPKKAMQLICGKPLLEWCVDSLRSEKFKIIIATTNRNVDDPIAFWAQKNGFSLFRGETENVAKRILDCAREYNLSNFARVNGDSPFVRKFLIEKGFELIKSSGSDFVTNLIPRHFPYGIAVEVFNTIFFSKVLESFTSREEKEHVTKYLYENIGDFKVEQMLFELGNYHHCRFTLDDKYDFERIERMLKLVGNKINYVSINELLLIYEQIK